MSSQPSTVNDEESLVAVSPVRPARTWLQNKFLRVVLGGTMMVVGLCQLNRGLHELAGVPDYGTLLKVNQSDLYYTSAVPKADAERLRDVLVGAKFCGENKVSMQITKSGKLLQFRFVVKPGFDKDESYIPMVQAMGVVLSTKAFGGAPLEIHLCDDHFQTLRVVPAVASGKSST
jgi:hypothetical protein